MARTNKISEVKLIDVNIPKSYAELMLERCLPYIDKYYRYEKFKNSMTSNLGTPEFGLRELVMSCYSQGLIDSKEATESVLNKQKDVR